MTTIFLGRTADRERVYADVRLEPIRLDRGYLTIEHEPVEGGYDFAASFQVIEFGHRLPFAVGQVPSENRVIVEPGDVDLATARRLDEVWRRWHLNTMRAGCAHMPTRADHANNLLMPVSGWNSYALDNLVCAETGYQYGRAWLTEPLPDDIVAFITDLIGVRA